MFPGTHARTAPDRPAIIVAETGERVSYGELDAGSTRLSWYLREAGFVPGDVIALLASNSPRFLEVYWGIVRSGMYVAAINHHQHPDEVRHIVRHCGARGLIVSADLRPLALGLDQDAAPDVEVRLAFGGDVAGYQRYEHAVASAPTAWPEDQPRGADLLYSSGTTGGQPKGIKPPLPDRQVGEPGDYMVDTFAPRWDFGPDTVYLSPAPLYHGGPLRFAVMTLSVGGTVVMLTRFDAEKALAAIECHGVTHSQWVPTMFVRILKLPADVRERYDLSSHRYAIHASAPCPEDVKRALIDWWGPIVEEYYASQEAAGITLITCEEWLAKPGSVGRPVLGDIRICGPHGQVLPPGEVGDIYFARDVIPFTYHDDPERTRQAQHPEHETWSTAGDVGYVDEDGYLFLTDRKAFMIITGGVNIFPQEAEDVLALHEAVQDVAVVGVPDDDLGEVAKAVVQPAPHVTPTDALAKELLAYVQTRLSRYKCPRSLDFVEELPRTPTGKLVKGELTRRYRELAGSDTGGAA